MSTETTLLGEIAADPDDDQPRLVLADWYDEHGDPRGEFIRVQCELETLDWDDPRHFELKEIEDGLITRHRAKWVKTLPKLKGVAWGSYDSAVFGTLWDVGRQHFRRGFVELATIKDFKSWQDNQKALKKYGLTRHLVFNNYNDKIYKAISKLDSLRAVGIWQGEAEWLSQCASRESLTSLTFHECHLGNAGLGLLAELELPSLQRLDLGFNSLQFPYPAFYDWKVLSQLKYLDLGLNHLGGATWEGRTRRYDPKGFASFVRLPAIKNLHVLNLFSNDLSTPHMEELVKSRSLKRLTELALSSNDLGDEGLGILAAANFPSLRLLDLNRTGITDTGIKSIAESQQMSSLRRLDISNNDIGDNGIVAIAESEHLSGLTHLNIPRLKFGEKGAKALTESKTLNSIRYLNIGNAELKVATLKALQKRFPKAVVKKPYH